MEHWVLASSPLAVSIRNWRVLWQNSSHIPIEQIWIISQCLCMESMIVHHDWSVALETTTKTANYKVDDPAICEPATDVEVLDR
jgi:hypothetical protein